MQMVRCRRAIPRGQWQILALLGIHLDLTGQLPAHDGPTHPDGKEQTQRHKSQVRKGSRAVRLEDAPFGNEQPDERAEYSRDQDRAAKSKRAARRLDHYNPAREQKESHQGLYRPDRRRPRQNGRDGPVIERLARRVPGPVDQTEWQRDSNDEAEGVEAFMFHMAPANTPTQPLDIPGDGVSVHGCSLRGLMRLNALPCAGEQAMALHA